MTLNYTATDTLNYVIATVIATVNANATTVNANATTVNANATILDYST